MLNLSFKAWNIYRIFSRCKMVVLTDHYGSAFLFIATFSITYIVVKKIRGSSAGSGRLPMPPSLPSLPVIGSALHLPIFSSFHKGIFKWKKTKGGILGLYLGPWFSVVLQGREAIQEAFVKKSVDFANRFPLFLMVVMNPGSRGIIDRRYDETFKQLHHLSITTLRKLGFGKEIMESRIHREVEFFVSQANERDGKSFLIDPLLSVCVMNVIITILFGQSFRQLDKARDDFISDINRFVHDVMKVFVLNALPWLRFLPGMRSRFIELCNTHDRMMKFLSDTLEKSFQLADNDEEEVSFVSLFRDAKTDFDRTELLYVLRDLMIAGTETSVTSLRWALVELANRPELQAKLQREIDSVVVNRYPSLNDRTNLPMLDATILELMRFHTIVPLSAPRKAVRNMDLLGYHIPAGTMIFASLYSVHMDPEVWSDPTSFRPERFLSADGQKVVKKELLLPFSAGRRSCIGELLARQEIFLFVAGILQHFDIRPPDEQDQIVVTEVQLLTLAPSPFNIRLIPRSVSH